MDICEKVSINVNKALITLTRFFCRDQNGDYYLYEEYSDLASDLVLLLDLFDEMINTVTLNTIHHFYMNCIRCIVLLDRIKNKFTKEEVNYMKHLMELSMKQIE